MGRGPLLLMWLLVVSFVTFGPLACRTRVIMVFVRISLTTSSYRVLCVLIFYDRWPLNVYLQPETVESLHFCLCDPGFQHSPIVAAPPTHAPFVCPVLMHSCVTSVLSRRLTGKLASPWLPSLGMQVLWSLLLSCMNTYSMLGAELALAVLQPWRKGQNPSCSEEGMSSPKQPYADNSIRLPEHDENESLLHTHCSCLPVLPRVSTDAEKTPFISQA